MLEGGRGRAAIARWASTQVRQVQRRAVSARRASMRREQRQRARNALVARMRRRGRDHARSARRASILSQPLLYASNVALMPIMTLLVARLVFAILDTLVMDRAARLVRRASSRRP